MSPGAGKLRQSERNRLNKPTVKRRTVESTAAIFIAFFCPLREMARIYL